MSSSTDFSTSLDTEALKHNKDDVVSTKLLMLVEGVSGLGAKKAAQKYGYSEQRYYQLLKAFKARGSQALINKKPGPRTKSVRTDLVKNLVIRYKFLDQAQSSEVIAQKLRQDGHKISCSSVRRILAEFGLEKKNFISSPRLKNNNKSTIR